MCNNGEKGEEIGQAGDAYGELEREARARSR